MKNRLLLGFAGVLLVASVAAWLFQAESPPVSTILPEAKATRQGNLAQEPVKQPHEDRTQPPSMPTPPGYEGLSDPRWKERERKLLIDEVYEWKMPINFYGRVVDEMMLPVVDAKIQFQWSDLSESGASDAEAVSDSTGRFELVGKNGNGLTVRVSKNGYYTPLRTAARTFENTRFWDVNYYKPNATNPVLFHLRKKGEGEMLIQGGIRPRIPPDGTPARFDLLNKGRISSGGQLEVAAVTNTEMYPPRFFNWRASVSVPDGGLLEYDTEFPFQAPETGYKNRIEFEMLEGGSGWRRSIDKSYFIQFGTPPKYGRVNVHLSGASQTIGIDYWINPSGTRNLEPREQPQVSTR